jgi:hypothetical protein
MANDTPDIQAGLTSVLGGLLAHAEDERRKEVPYQMLFGAFKDGGAARAVFAAHDQMERIAMDLMQVLEEGAGLEIDGELFAVLMGLPLAKMLAEREIEQKEGVACCVDKADLLLRTYLYEKLGLVVEAKPFSDVARPTNLQRTKEDHA